MKEQEHEEVRMKEGRIDCQTILQEGHLGEEGHLGATSTLLCHLTSGLVRVHPVHAESTVCTMSTVCTVCLFVI